MAQTAQSASLLAPDSSRSSPAASSSAAAETLPSGSISQSPSAPAPTCVDTAPLKLESHQTAAAARTPALLGPGNVFDAPAMSTQSTGPCHRDSPPTPRSDI